MADMTTIELKHIPSPPRTYYVSSQSTGGTSKNPFYQPTNEEQAPPPPRFQSKALLQEEPSPVRPDFEDPNHPHFVEPPIFKDFFPTLPSRSNTPSKRLLIPWVLAAVFFLISVWYTSILLGARFASLLRPQEINVVLKDGFVHDGVTTSIMVATPTTTKTLSTTVPPSTSSGINDDTASHLAPVVENPPKDTPKTKRSGIITTQERHVAEPTGFVTVIRRTA